LWSEKVEPKLSGKLMTSAMATTGRSWC
jgi:hypothetical protein